MPEDTRHIKEEMDRIGRSIERRRRAGQLAAHAAVRVQPHRRRAKRTATVFINKPHLTVGYDQLTEVQQRALSNVVGTGRTLVRTGDQLSVTQLNELSMQRLQEARSESTWKSLGSPYNQFQRFRVEVLSEEAQESAMELQLMWWIESKLADGSISMQTGNKYVRRVRQVMDMVNTCYVADRVQSQPPKVQSQPRQVQSQPPKRVVDFWSQLNHHRRTKSTTERCKVNHVRCKVNHPNGKSTTKGAKSTTENAKSTTKK